MIDTLINLCLFFPTQALFSLTGCIILVAGLYSVLTQAHLIRKILGINFMGSGLFLIIVSLAYKTTGSAPDPISHGLVLTGLVVSVAATALFLALVIRLHRTNQQLTLDAELTKKSQ